MTSISVIDIDTLSPALYYLSAYTFVSAIIFLLLMSISDNNEKNLSFDSFINFKDKYPYLTFTLVVAMLSFIGFPYTIGFLAKVDVFMSAITNGYYTLAFLGILMTIVSLYYYLNFIKHVYFSKSDRVIKVNKISFKFNVFMIFLSIMIIVCGFGLFGSSFIVKYFY